MDISDGFHCIEVAKEHRKYLTFNLMGCVIRHRVLPFGWTGSPHVFCKVVSVLTRLLRNPDMPARLGDMQPSHWLMLRDLLLARDPLPYSGVRTLPFVDDYLMLFSTREAALQGVKQIKRTMEFLGLEPSATKCIWEPTQRLVHLGLEL